MAPRKAAIDANPTKVSVTQGNNKVVKRPARGYHRYKNGMLNVTPKGSEIDLVKQNQNSPLLRLPPEIRNFIWEYTLGRQIYRLKYPYNRHNRTRGVKFTFDPEEPSSNLALLRTCRQIYSETALLPIRLSTLTFDRVGRIQAVKKHFSLHHRKEIKVVRLELKCSERYLNGRIEGLQWILQYLPALERVEVLVFKCFHPSKLPSWSFIHCDVQEHIRDAFPSDELEHTGISLTVTQMVEDMPVYYNDLQSRGSGFWQ